MQQNSVTTLPLSHLDDVIPPILTANLYWAKFVPSALMLGVADGVIAQFELPESFVEGLL